MAGFCGLVWVAYAIVPKEIKSELTQMPYTLVDVELIAKPQVIVVANPDLPAAKKVASTRFVPLVVKPDIEVSYTAVATQKELENAIVASTNSDGEATASKDNNIIAQVGIIAVAGPAENDFLEYAEQMPSFPSEYVRIWFYWFLSG